MLEDARLNALLHKTNCNFKKIPGKTYYIYKQKKNPDEEFLSMISLEEWGASCPEYVGGYRLEFDMSWTELKVSISRFSVEKATIQTLMSVSYSVHPSINPSTLPPLH